MPSQTFTSSGTWTCPTDYLPGSLVVMCWGEGGTGGTSAHGSRGGGGGGGGEWAQDTPAVTAGNNYSVTVGAGSTGTNTTFVGDSLTVTAHAGGASPGQGGGSGGTGSTNASHFDGGAGGSAGAGSSVSGAGGGGSAGSGSTGGAGAASVTGGTAGTGTNPGAVGGAGGTSLNAGNNGNTPGSGGGGGGSGGSINHSGGNGAAGQVILTWQSFVPAPPPVQRSFRQPVPEQSLIQRVRSAETLIPHPVTVNTEAIHYPQHMIAELIRHGRTVAPTGWPVPVQPLFPPGNAERRWVRPPYPRRGVTITPWLSRNIPPSESYRARYKPPYPRRGVVPPTGWPVPVQPPTPSSTGVFPHLRTRRRRPLHGEILWPGTPPVVVQPPWSSWVYKRRWSKPLFPRKGVVAPEALPPPPVVTAYNPTSLRRTQRYQWFRRGNVSPTGWPIPVQPPMTSQSLRRWYKPPWPRRGVIPPTNLPEPIPTSWQNRRSQKYQWFRRGRAVPNTGLPVPVQPPNVPHGTRRISLRQLLPRKQSPKFAAFFIPVQPPERMQSVRRWVKPLWPRRGRTDIATFPGAQTVTGYQLLPLQTFTYTPGGAGLDLGTLGLTLFPLNKLGFSFWNRYGDVVFIVWNNTPLDVAITPNVIRQVELQSVSLPQYTLAPGAIQAFGPYPPNDFTDPQLANPSISYYMTVAVEANSSGVFAGAFRMVNAPPYGHTGPYDVIGLRLAHKISTHHVNTSSTPGEIHPGETTPGA